MTIADAFGNWRTIEQVRILFQQSQLDTL
jgi:hypothetical protein